MDKQVFLYSCFFLVSVFVCAVSQVMLKKAALKQYERRIMEYLNPLVIGAYLIFAGTTFLSILAYRYVPLSLGPVMEATSYIYVTFFGVTIFGEKINARKILALFLIIVGIIVYAVTG